MMESDRIRTPVRHQRMYAPEPAYVYGREMLVGVRYFTLGQMQLFADETSALRENAEAWADWQTDNPQFLNAQAAVRRADFATALKLAFLAGQARAAAFPELPEPIPRREAAPNERLYPEHLLPPFAAETFRLRLAAAG